MKKQPERIIPLKNKKKEIYGFIVIDTTEYGPAVGGTRIHQYSSPKDALHDAIQLAHTMTMKCIMANIPFGGGKGVIMGAPRIKNESLLKDYAKEINKLKGTFFTGEDVGTTSEDIGILSQESPYILGSKNEGPSPYAALSVLRAMQTALLFQFGSPNLKGRCVAVKGIGKVGEKLVKQLMHAGAQVTIADLNHLQLTKLKKLFPSIIISQPEIIHRKKVDIYAPCALGNDITVARAKECNASIICGAENNQLSSSRAGHILFQKNTLYVPDIIANAGGLIQVVDELEHDGYRTKRVLKRIHELQKLLFTILNKSKKEKRNPETIAKQIAKNQINSSL